MDDFETHDVGYVAYLKGRIFELKQDVAALSASDESWERFCRTKDAEIKALREGACRFNCRTRKEAFIDGFRYGVVRVGRIAGVGDSVWSEDDQEMAEMAYKEYLEQENRANP